MTEVTYIAKNAPAYVLRFKTAMGARICQFENKLLHLNSDDPVEAECIATLDKLIATRADIRIEVSKMDRDAALSLAEAHRKQKGPAAVSGTFSSIDSPSREADMQKRADELRREGATEADIQKMLNEMRTALQLTEESGEVVRDKTGFIPDATETPKTDEIPAPAEPAKVVDTLFSKSKTDT